MKTVNLLFRTLALCGAFLFVSLLQQPARGDLLYSYTTAISSYLPPGAGLTQFYSSVAPASATTGQGQVTAASTASYTVLSETFTPTSNETLGGFDVLEAGNSGSAMIVRLYDVTSSGSSNNGTFTQGSGATYPAGLTDLFGNGNGLTFTTPNAPEVQGQFLLSNGTANDQVALIGGHSYSLEFWAPTIGSGTITNNFIWYRGGAVATDGQMMGTADANTARVTIASLGLAGGAPRTASLALYTVPVPEPSTLALIGCGLVAVLLGRQAHARLSV